MSLTKSQEELREKVSGEVVVGQATRWGLAATLGVGTASLVLSMIGVMTPWLAVPIGAVTALVAARKLPTRLGPVSWPATLALSLLVAGVVGFGWAVPHEHILGTRDSGTYVATAAWITQTGGLWMEVGSPAFDGASVSYESMGFPAGGNETGLRPQFLHFFPSLLALAGALRNDPAAIFWVNPVIAGVGILALFAFARCVLTQWGAVSVSALVAVCLPFIYFYRAPFTEPLALAFVFGSLWVLYQAMDRNSLSLASGAGLLLGGVLLTRIDGIIVFLGLTAYLTLLDLSSTADADTKGDRQEPAAAVIQRTWNVAGLMYPIAIIDGLLFSPKYIADHGTLIGAVLLGILILRIVGQSGPRLASLFDRHRKHVANGAAVLLAAFLLYSWIGRPHLEAPIRSDIYGVAGLQEAAGVAVEPLRSYAELSVHWLVWYLGVPLVAAGLIALVVLVRRALLGTAGLVGPFAIVAAVATLPYLYRPSINPDQIWAMRRFLPVVIPALVVLAVWLWQQASGRLGRFASIAALAVAVSFALPAVAITANAGPAPEFEGAGQAVHQVCDRLGPDAALLFVGESSGSRADALMPLLRGWCGFPVAVERETQPLDADTISALAQRGEAEGFTLWVAGEGAGSVGRSVTLFDHTVDYLEISLLEPPRDWVTLTIRIPAAQVR